MGPILAQRNELQTSETAGSLMISTIANFIKYRLRSNRKWPRVCFCHRAVGASAWAHLVSFARNQSWPGTMDVWGEAGSQVHSAAWADPHGRDGCTKSQSTPRLESEPPGKWSWRHIQLSYSLDILGLVLVSQEENISWNQKATFSPVLLNTQHSSRDFIAHTLVSKYISKSSFWHWHWHCQGGYQLQRQTQTSAFHIQQPSSKGPELQKQHMANIHKGAKESQVFDLFDLTSSSGGLAWVA